MRRVKRHTKRHRESDRLSRLCFLGDMTNVSVEYGSGENGKMRRRELMAVLMGRLDACLGEGRCEDARAILDGLAGLMEGRRTSEVAEALEMLGIFSHPEALHFCGADPEQMVAVEAIPASQALSTPVRHAFWHAPMAESLRIRHHHLRST